MDGSSVDEFWQEVRAEYTTETQPHIKPAHKAFMDIRDHACGILDASTLLQFERACDALLLSDKDITPLLVHYDQIRRNIDI